MNPQFINSPSKLQYQNKVIQSGSKKHKPRESQPPLMQSNLFTQNLNQYRVRKPRPSEIGYQTAMKQGLNKKAFQQILLQENSKRGINPTKKQTLKYKEDSRLGGKLETTVQSVSRKNEHHPNSVNKINSANRFLSPDIKVASQHPNTERKLSQKLEDVNFFKGYQKPSAPNLNTKSNKNKIQNFNNSKNSNTIRSQTDLDSIDKQEHPQKRIPRYSEGNNYSINDIQDVGTNTLYNKKSDKVQKTKSKDLSNTKKNNIEQYSRQNKINQSNEEKELLSPTLVLGGNSGFKKIKELKETVSTHSTFDSKKIEAGFLNSPLFKKNQIRIPNTSQRQQSELKVSDFIKGKELGNGKFGEVCIVKHKLTGFVCAMKSIPKAMIRQQNIINQLIRQLKIQTYLDHPNIIKLYGFFHDKNNIYLLLELGSSGQLYKVIKQKQKLSQQATSYIIKQVCQAIRYLHHFKIIHRDLKPENIVIQSGIIKICDFGWAVSRGTQLRSTFCGTPLYVSPEILKGQMYDEKVDLWAIGILTYQLLFGNIPFEITTEQQLIKIVKDDIEFPTHIKVSALAKDFILKILKKNPDERLKITQLLQHEFIKKAPQMACQLQIE